MNLLFVVPDKEKDLGNRNLWRDFLNFPYFTGFSAH